MRLKDYQEQAKKTDQTPSTNDDDLKAIMIPILGLAGEVGSLSTQYKKYLRDGAAYKIFDQKITEELGDILWYVSAIASKQGLCLEEIALKNLNKISDRWHDQKSLNRGVKLFDADALDKEKFPRQFELKVQTETKQGKLYVQLFHDAKPLGATLTDNAYVDDGYRLHDVFHLAFMTVLGWSPVMRKLFGCKRRSNTTLDENEDGGRANVIDEAIAALIFVEAKKNNFFDGIDSVEYGILRTIKDLTAHLEVSRCSMKEWEDAILTGFKIWRQVKQSHNGIIKGNLNEKTLEFIPADN